MGQTEQRRIALIGTVNRDTIHTADGVRVESYGGMLYSILSLAQIAEAMIFPVCNVGRDVEMAVRGFLAPFPCVRSDGIRFVPEPNPHCLLEYDAEGRKRETLRGGVPELSFERIAPFLDGCAVCLNFITGMELSLSTLQEVRAATGAPILMDVHSLTLGLDSERRRFWRVPPLWEAWLACADVVQLNLEEASLLAGGTLEGESAVRRFGEHVLGLGPHTLLITRGAQGSTTVLRSPAGQVEVRSFDAPPVGTSEDETGCGDVFLMGFTWAYLQTGDPCRASRFANRAASINCSLRGIEALGQIGRTLADEGELP
ncbi:MAG: carbohydrate kinase family protein [Candidatus Latescibacteria bacterium]|jgi:sugar/nucleoside kinase (ribokinase family)|nr:carbohydrate kinase family protein [Candidatus Latescibacterota bacterium]